MTHIVGLIGRKQAGKSTAAGMLSELNGFTTVKLADPLKNMLRTLFYSVGYGEEETEQYIEGDLKEEPVDFLGGKTPRYAMQTLGTEWGRNCIHDQFWVSAFGAAAGARRLVVCDDCRFPNEADYIASRGGVLIRLLSADEVAGNGGSDDRHPSEVEMDEIPVHHFVENTGTIRQLYEEVQKVAFNNGVPRQSLWTRGDE